MVIDQLGIMQTQQFKNTAKTQKAADNWVFNAHIDKLFNNHNHVLTRILQNSVKIPKELKQKGNNPNSLEKKYYFGIDNHIINPQLLPKDQGDFIIFHTKSVPVVVPKFFLHEEISQDEILTKALLINLVDDAQWWEINNENMPFSEFLKVGLVFFAQTNFLRKEKVKMVQIATTPYLPQRSVIFSMKCNFFSFIRFLLSNQQYFSNLQLGLNAYLKYINRQEKT